MMFERKMFIKRFACGECGHRKQDCNRDKFQHVQQTTKLIGKAPCIFGTKLLACARVLNWDSTDSLRHTCTRPTDNHDRQTNSYRMGELEGLGCWYLSANISLALICELRLELIKACARWANGAYLHYCKEIWMSVLLLSLIGDGTAQAGMSL